MTQDVNPRSFYTYFGQINMSRNGYLVSFFYFLISNVFLAQKAKLLYNFWTRFVNSGHSGSKLDKSQQQFYFGLSQPDQKMKAQQVLENCLEYRLNFLNQILSELKVLISLVHLSIEIEVYSVIFFQINEKGSI